MMKTYRLYVILRNAALAALVFVLASKPALVAAKSLQKDPQAQAMDLLLKGGDVYLTSVSNAVIESAELMQPLQVVQNTPINQLSEAYIEGVINRALEAAEQSSIALGAVDDLADGIQAIGNDFPAAMDVGAAAGAGLPVEMRADLAALGIPSTTVDQISGSISTLYLARQSAAASLPADLQASLLGYGFTQSQIDQIAAAVGERGLVNSSLSTRLQQLRAAQDELADTRSGLVVLAVQLLGYQIAVRQSDGIQPRAITDAELEALAQDELRLLVHAAHLKALWGNDPNSETGEGDWWFIEHYAGRAAERLQTVIVETQNRGLVTDLFLAHQMQMLAVSARSGDAEYAKAELDALAALLAHRLDAVAYYQQQASPNVLVRALARFATLSLLRETVSWPLSEGAIKNAKLVAQSNLETSGVQSLAPLLGSFDESNETNNMGGLLIAAGLEFFDQVKLDIAQTGLAIISATTPENVLLWIKAILTGDTDNPVLLGANMVLSLIPVIGVIPDIVTLVVDPSLFVKALSIFGIIGSVGDIIALIPGLQPAGGASFVGDAVATVVKTLFKQADGVFRAVLNALKLADAFDVVLDLVKTTIRFVGSFLGHSLDEVITTLRNLFTGGFKLWDNFVAFVRRVGTDLLLKLGFDEGSALVGRILNLGIDLSDEALVTTQKIGREIAEAGIDLSDNAAKGLGNAVDILGEAKARRLLSICSIGFVPSPIKLALIIPSPLLANPCSEAAEAFQALSKNAKAGYRNIPVEKIDEIFLTGGKEQLEQIGLVASKFGGEITEQATDGLTKLIRENLGDVADNIVRQYSQDVADKTLRLINDVPYTWQGDSYEGIARLLSVKDPGNNYSIVKSIMETTGDAGFGESLFRRIKLATDAEIPGLDHMLKEMNGTWSSVKGAHHALEYSDLEIGFKNINRMEIQLGPDPQRAIDVLDNNGMYYELKNVESWTSANKDQLEYYLTYLSPSDQKRLHYVFRAPENEAILTAFENSLKSILDDEAAIKVILNNVIWYP